MQRENEPCISHKRSTATTMERHQPVIELGVESKLSASETPTISITSNNVKCDILTCTQKIIMIELVRKHRAIGAMH